MKKTIVIAISLCILMGLILIINPTITGRITQQNMYSYTYAICNETNYCEDHLIECEGDTPTKITSTGLSIQHKKNWQDSRQEHDFCKQ